MIFAILAALAVTGIVLLAEKRDRKYDATLGTVPEWHPTSDESEPPLPINIFEASKIINEKYPNPFAKYKGKGNWIF